MKEVIDPASCIGALRRAKEFIVEDWERFICIALAEVQKDEPSLTDACCILVDYIGDRCSFFSHGNSTLEDWLIFEMGLRDGLPHDTYRLCRMAWIDRMILELETNGRLP